MGGGRERRLIDKACRTCTTSRHDFGDIDFLRDFDQTSTTNSGLTKEKPGNSVWSRFMIKSLSVGVSRGGSLVNSESKLEMSRALLCNEKRCQVVDFQVYCKYVLC